MSMQNPLARARGLGSAKEGVHHWFAQRASALLLIFLGSWFMYSLVRLSGGEYAAAQAFLSNPFNAAIMSVLLITLLYHAMLGLQVVIEDYVHNRTMEIVLHFLTRAGAFLGMAVGVIYLVKLALGS